VLPAGASFGHYTIESVLGAGGMGVVYRARQERPAREVALKVIRPGLASSQALRRFELEAEALGRLQHPGIAQVYEAGASADGQPFFAMELVRGEPLTHFADSHELNTRQRLELFAKVCDAVQHAHTKGVIHRDLKPGNILVDGAGQPKILDFGVARVTHHDVQPVTVQTDLGQLIGTVPYMSPEQVEGDPAALDTRSDVYALGVVLYELLTGRLPYDLNRKLIHEAARIIREDEPTRLSSINRTLRGEVETIALKALEKDKSRRYQSASDLGSDVSRFLRDEPIVARPATRLYQLRKFAKRNKALVGGVLAAFVLLSAGLVGTTYGLVQAERQRRLSERNAALARNEAQRADGERREAQRQTAVAQEVVSFLTNDLLAQASPEVEPDPDLKLRTVVERARAKLDGRFADEPAIESRLRLTIGRVFGALGLTKEAEQELQRAEQLTLEGPGDSSLEMADVAHARAWIIGFGGSPEDMEAARRHCESAHAIRSSILGPHHPQALVAAGDAAMFRALAQGRSAALFDPLILSVVAAASGTGKSAAQFETEIRALVVNVERLAGIGDFDTAQSLIEKEMTPYISNPSFARRVPLVLMGASMELSQQGFKGAALEGLKVAKRLGERLLGPDHPNTIGASTTLASALDNAGRSSEAEPLAREALASARRILGDAHEVTLISMSNLGVVLMSMGQTQEAEGCFREAHDTLARTSGSDSRHAVPVAINYGEALCRNGKYEKAISILTRFQAMPRATVRAAGPEARARMLTALGRSRVELGFEEERFTLAEAELLEAHAELTSLYGPSDRDVLRSAARLAKLYQVWDRAQPGKGWDLKAEEWRLRTAEPAPTAPAHAR